MNNDRRKALREALDRLREGQTAVDLARDIIEAAATDEREYFDAMPENMQGGDKGQRAEQVASELEEAQSTLDEVDQQLTEIIGMIEGALE